ncbi:GNAT family N-acetyltransferase [Sphingomonas gilva]|uniref:GNAT family N-acetyltransferase n=1 Tax=Sphingomonas gilva TaxID=2305907 RepID=A0A396RPA6_9SPHN|nr:GNAT family N-acetyltransferase [Sphingomonas gilva]RHW18278.1 GNAT family N-acetyltransferase [Sphingomonas gilva]
MATARAVIDIRRATRDDLPQVMSVMTAAFDPQYGEAWSESQLAGMLMGGAARLSVAYVARAPAGFALTRTVADETELMLLATHPDFRDQGVANALLRAAMDDARADGAETMFLEVRRGNSAERLYTRNGFANVGERREYYRGNKGQVFDARTFRRALI